MATLLWYTVVAISPCSVRIVFLKPLDASAQCASHRKQPLLVPLHVTNHIRALDMNLDNQIPIRIRHVLEADVPKDARIVDEHIYPSKVLDGRLDNLVSILDAIVVGNGFATGRANFVDDYIGCLYNLTLALESLDGERRALADGSIAELLLGMRRTVPLRTSPRP